MILVRGEEAMVRTLGTVVCLTASLLCLDTVTGTAQGPPAAVAESTVIVMLGTGTPRPLPDVWGASTEPAEGRSPPPQPATRAATKKGRQVLADGGIMAKRKDRAA